VTDTGRAVRLAHDADLDTAAAFQQRAGRGECHANGLLVLTLAGDQISVMTRFDNSVLAAFGLHPAEVMTPQTAPA
jgi:hypothetical protein